MIKTKFDEITLKDYKRCLVGDTICLHIGLKLFKNRIKQKTDNAFIDISDRLNNAIESSNNGMIIKMWKKIQSNSTRLRIYIMSYQIQCIVKNKRNIELLAQNGFIYNESLSHSDNLQLLAGQIDRYNSQVNGMEKEFIKISEGTKQVDVTLEDVIMTINNSATCNLSLSSTLADFIAASNLLKKIEKLNKK